jgi:hypothetical protein
MYVCLFKIFIHPARDILGAAIKINVKIFSFLTTIGFAAEDFFNETRFRLQNLNDVSFSI